MRVRFLWFAAAVGAGAAETLCPCASGSSLMQARGIGSRPKDCTCITGMKTYQTTPRDQLKALGKVGLRHHLEKCERNRNDLDKQLDYQTAAGGKQVANVQKKLDRKENALEGLKNSTAKTKATDSDKKKKLVEETNKLEGDLTTLKGEYNSQFTAWFKMNQDSSSKLMRLESCENPKPECKPKPTTLLQQHSRRLTPEQRLMYDHIEKVEKCEDASIKLAEKVQETQSKAGRAMIGASDRMERIEQEDKDHRYVSGILSKKPQIDALEKRKTVLTEAVEAEQRSVDDYKQRNEVVKETLKKLDSELTDCGC